MVGKMCIRITHDRAESSGVVKFRICVYKLKKYDYLDLEILVNISNISKNKRAENSVDTNVKCYHLSSPYHVYTHMPHHKKFFT